LLFYWWWLFKYCSGIVYSIHWLMIFLIHCWCKVTWPSGDDIDVDVTVLLWWYGIVTLWFCCYYWYLFIDDDIPDVRLLYLVLFYSCDAIVICYYDYKLLLYWCVLFCGTDGWWFWYCMYIIDHWPILYDAVIMIHCYVNDHCYSIKLCVVMLLLLLLLLHCCWPDVFVVVLWYYWLLM